MSEIPTQMAYEVGASGAVGVGAHACTDCLVYIGIAPEHAGFYAILLAAFLRGAIAVFMEMRKAQLARAEIATKLLIAENKVATAPLPPPDVPRADTPLP